MEGERWRGGEVERKREGNGEMDRLEGERERHRKEGEGLNGRRDREVEK